MPARLADWRSDAVVIGTYRKSSTRDLMFERAEKRIVEVKAATSGSQFEWDFPMTATTVEVWGSGEAAGRMFTAHDPVSLMDVEHAEPSPLDAAVAKVEARLRRYADEVYRANPLPAWTRSEEASMTYKQRADRLIDEYTGASISGVSLAFGPAEWLGFLVETGLQPGSTAYTAYRGALMVLGPASGVRYNVKD